MAINLEGSFVALVTPFNNDKVDELKIKKLVKWHIENGTKGIVACGTTGEAPTLSLEEQGSVISAAVEAAENKIDVIAGTGSNNTHHVIEATKQAERLGARGALIVCPYYNKPTQNGLYEHFKAVASSVALDIIVYNIPGRTSVNMEPATLASLSNDYKNIVGVKECSGSMDQVTSMIKACRPGFAVMAGDDSLTLPIIAMGGKGLISTAANIVPAQISELVKWSLAGDLDRARALHLKLFPLLKTLFIETNPGPVKEAMQIMGLIENSSLRLPMAAMDDANRKRLQSVLEEFGLAR